MSNLLKHLLFTFSLILTLSYNSIAQTPMQFIKSGDKYFQDGDFYNALDAYYNAFLQDSLSPLPCFKYAEALRSCNSYLSAANLYSRVLETDTKNQFKSARFWKALMLKYEGEYEESKEEFQNFISFYKQSDTLRSRALQEIESVSWAIDHIKDSAKVLINHFSKEVNTGSSEFGIFILQDSLVHFSRIEDWNKKVGKESVYKAKTYQLTHNNFALPTIDLPGMSDSSLLHYTNYTYDSRNQILYYSICQNVNVSSLRCKISFSKWVKNSWTEPETLPEPLNLDPYTYTQPAVAYDVKNIPSIYFVSDMKGGKGGLDIWKVIFTQNMEISKIENVQGRVNTNYNEVTPFVDQKSLNLYFSSDGHLGLGGYDIYKVNTEAVSNRKSPENLKFPINSSRNDLYYMVTKDSSKGYFTSNRKGSEYLKGEGCCNDLYSWSNLQSRNFDSTLLTSKTSKKMNVDSQIVTRKVTSILEEKLPITVYFHNDIPDPASLGDTSLKNYKSLYESYSEMKYMYLRYFDKDPKRKDDVVKFFSDKVDEGFYKLMLFVSKLKKELESGKSFKLGIQAYCSPLANSDYNVHLANRRIASIVNYIYHFQEGSLQKYFANKQLVLEHVPYGESQSPISVNDNRLQVDKSVYDPSAAMERRVSIIYIKENE